MQILLCILTFFAGLSPLLTFARLWQVKEWRFDRLREHLRHEGWCRQLFGWVRPLVIVLGIVTNLLLLHLRPSDQIYAPLGALGLLAWFTLFRFVIGKQARPVWTAKACGITALSALLLLLVTGILCRAETFVGLMLLPLFPALFVLLALIILFPLDRFLKRRILSQAKAKRETFPNLTVVGITGSVGKTMTKELLAHILRDRSILATPAHVNTEMGVAQLMLEKLKEDHQIFLVEMGAYCKGEIATLCSLTHPQIGIITFIGTQHLGLFGSREDLCKAKGELFAALPPEGHALLNADTKYSEELMKRAACPVHTVGTGGHASYEAFDIQECPQGISFTLRAVPFTVPLQGTHQVTNVLLAVAAAELFGVPLAESAKRLKDFAAPAQTFEKKEGKSGQIVLDDTHNASPASFRAAVEWARTHPAKTKVLVTSGLLELGKEECVIHQELGSLSQNIFTEVLFLSKKCVRSFEQGYGKTVKVAPKKKFSIKLAKDMLIVCEGRMPKSIIDRLLS